MSFKRFSVFILITGLAFIAVQYSNFMMISPNQVDIISYGALAVGILGVAYNVLKTISIPVNKEVFDLNKDCKDDPLNTSGLYRTVKYPALAGDFLTLISFAMYSAMHLYVIVAAVVFYLVWIRDIIKLNKEYEQEYGADYVKWGKGLNAFFPNILRYRGIGRYPSWKNVNPWYPVIYGLVISALHVFREYTVFQEFEIQDMARVIVLISVLATLILLVKKGLAKD